VARLARRYRHQRRKTIPRVDLLRNRLPPRGMAGAEPPARRRSRAKWRTTNRRVQLQQSCLRSQTPAPMAEAAPRWTRSRTTCPREHHHELPSQRSKGEAARPGPPSRPAPIGAFPKLCAARPPASAVRARLRPLRLGQYSCPQHCVLTPAKRVAGPPRRHRERSSHALRIRFQPEVRGRRRRLAAKRGGAMSPGLPRVAVPRSQFDPKVR
jgi:hypothetical protein